MTKFIDLPEFKTIADSNCCSNNEIGLRYFEKHNGNRRKYCLPTICLFFRNVFQKSLFELP